MIIDVHAHLGDICFPGGGALIERKGVRKRWTLDVISISEFLSHPWTESSCPASPNRLVQRLDLKASMARNLAATRENFRKSMDAAGVTLSAALPVAPNVTFADVKAASDKDPAIIPFTSVDFSREYDVEAAIAADVAAGARGLKLHPVLQREKLTSSRTRHAVEVFAPYSLPVLIHAGICFYYPDSEDRWREKPAYGDLPDVLELVKSFPLVKFIVGHAGLRQVSQAMDLFAGLSNVWVEGTFQSPHTIRRLIWVFGPDRVLFASDWPWANRIPAVRIMRKACLGDKSLERRIFFENAAALMRL